MLNSSFGFVFTEDFEGPFTLIERVSLNCGQHFDIFSIGHNRKDVEKKNTTEELIGGSELERLAIAIMKSQPTRHSYHIAFVDQAVELGRNEEEGSKVGNQKFTLSK
jgi:hypothetical protein